jgi:hypothetical protein
MGASLCEASKRIIRLMSDEWSDCLDVVKPQPHDEGSDRPSTLLCFPSGGPVEVLDHPGDPTGSFSIRLYRRGMQPD